MTPPVFAGTYLVHVSQLHYLPTHFCLLLAKSSKRSMKPRTWRILLSKCIMVDRYIVHMRYSPPPGADVGLTVSIRPVSDWAFSQMVAKLDRQGADAAYHFYRAIQGSRNSAELVGRMFETKVHVFFQSITTPRTFTAFSLDDRSTTFDIEFSSSTTHYTSGAKQYFTGELASS